MHPFSISLRFLANFHNSTNGGFGLWDGLHPSPFHTSLVLSVLGKIKSYIHVPEDILLGARSFLANYQQLDGSYRPQSDSVHRMFPDSTLSSIAMTAYVVSKMNSYRYTISPVIYIFMFYSWPICLFIYIYIYYIYVYVVPQRSSIWNDWRKSDSISVGCFLQLLW